MTLNGLNGHINPCGHHFSTKLSLHFQYQFIQSIRVERQGDRRKSGVLHHHWIYGDSVDKEEEEVIKMERDWVHARRLRGQNGHQVNAEAVAVDIQCLYKLRKE